MANIQGNGIVGFNKRFQTLLHYHIDDPARFKPAVAALGSSVSTAADVLAFNRLFKRDPSRQASWMNVAFTYAALAKLRDDVDRFADASFRHGMVRRSAALGDPEDPNDPGNPRNWKVRDSKGNDTADLMVIVAADTADLRNDKVREVRELIEGIGGATRIQSDEGVALSGPSRRFGGARALRISRRYLATATARPRFRGRDRLRDGSLCGKRSGPRRARSGPRLARRVRLRLPRSGWAAERGGYRLDHRRRGLSAGPGMGEGRLLPGVPPAPAERPPVQQAPERERCRRRSPDRRALGLRRTDRAGAAARRPRPRRQQRLRLYAGPERGHLPRRRSHPQGSSPHRPRLRRGPAAPSAAPAWRTVRAAVDVDAAGPRR